MEIEDSMALPKSDLKSALFRKLGKDHCLKKTTKDYLIALKLYNKAICFATTDSENLCFAYAERSVLYFNLYMFEACLKNIELVKKINKYPADRCAELTQREMVCRTILAQDDPYNDDDEWKEPELSYPPHENVPFIANCLEIRHNGLYGNHIVTNRDLKVGDIVAILKPYIMSPAPRFHYERCENCCTEHFQNLIPCPTCTVAMFCDEKCLKEAMDGFHQYECIAINVINLIVPYHQDKLALRLIMKGLSLYKDIDKFLDATEKLFKKNVHMFEIDHQNHFDQYAAVCSLKKATATARTNVTDLAQMCDRIFAASNIVSKKPRSKFNKILQHIVQQQFLMVEINGLLCDDLSYHIVNKRCTKYDDRCFTNNMSGIFPFIQLLPHSCISNVLCSSFTNGKIITIVRPIKAGEQLFHSFG